MVVQFHPREVLGHKSQPVIDLTLKFFRAFRMFVSMFAICATISCRQGIVIPGLDSLYLLANTGYKSHKSYSTVIFLVNGLRKLNK